MTRPTLLLSGLLTLISATAFAAPKKAAGTRGTVSAYSADGARVLAVKYCARKGKRSWNYVTCGKTFRARIKARICRTRGKGSHKWRYRVGDNKSRLSTVYCK